MSNTNPEPQNPYATNEGGTPLSKPQDSAQGANEALGGDNSTNYSQTPQNGTQGAYSIPPNAPQSPYAYQQNAYQQNAYQSAQGFVRPVDMTVSYVWTFFLGAFGAHKFYMGKTKEAVIYLVATLLSGILSFLGIGFLIGIFMIFMLYSDLRTMPEQVDEANSGQHSQNPFIWLQKAFSGGASPNRQP